jgi:hypothetical protein
MSAQKITISPKTKVGELLDNYPDLESVLLDMSPAFEKLKNPVLRKTVARVATLQQVAAVGGLKVDDIVNRLRNAAGQKARVEFDTDSGYLSSDVPDWFVPEKIVVILNASPIINSGGSPMNEILKQANILNPGEIFELRTPFIPAPIIDMLRTKGFSVYIVNMDSYILSYITRRL